MHKSGRLVNDLCNQFAIVRAVNRIKVNTIEKAYSSRRFLCKLSYNLFIKYIHIDFLKSYFLQFCVVVDEVTLPINIYKITIELGYNCFSNLLTKVYLRFLSISIYHFHFYTIFMFEDNLLVMFARLMQMLLFLKG